MYSFPNPQHRSIFVVTHFVPRSLWVVLPFPILIILQVPKRKQAPPSIFQYPKWKPQEIETFCLWENAIAFAHHLAKPLAQAMGQCLPLMMREAIRLYPNMPLRSFMGVRDMYLALLTFDVTTHPTMVHERDLWNWYLKIDEKSLFFLMRCCL